MVLGFMDSNDEILEDCFEESSNSITKLIEQPWIMNTIEIQKKINSIFKIEDFDSILSELTYLEMLIKKDEDFVNDIY